MQDDRQSPLERQRQIKTGCTAIGPRPNIYFKRFGALEYQQSFFDLPKGNVLTRLRQLAAPGFAFIFRAWQLVTHEPSFPGYRRLKGQLPHPSSDYGHFRPTAAVKQAWEQTAALAELLQAEGILFETPPSFTPSQTNRRQLTQFFESIARQERLMIWDPRGVWSPAETAATCADLQLVLATDPLAPLGPAEASPSPTAAGYFKMSGIGRSQGLRPLELEEVLTQARLHERCYCIFNTITMAKDAQRLVALAQEDDVPHEELT